MVYDLIFKKVKETRLNFIHGSVANSLIKDGEL